MIAKLIMVKLSNNYNVPMPDISVIVPTYKECKNLEALTNRLFKSLQNPKNCELIIVDDNSCDGSEELVKKLSSSFNVRIIVRKDERGLSSAVLKGFDEAKGEYLVCMDADLQHPPESVQSLVDLLDENEFAIGTRYASENSIDKNWSLYRKIISSGARLLARPLSPLSDPMTGFFAIRKNVYRKATEVDSIGFKICLELFVKCKVTRSSQVPIVFGVRTEGESKLSSKIILSYLKHLLKLYYYVYPQLFQIAVVIVVVLTFLVLGQ